MSVFSEKHTHNMHLLQQNVKHMQRDVMHMQFGQMMMMGQSQQNMADQALFQALHGALPPGKYMYTFF